MYRLPMFILMALTLAAPAGAQPKQTGAILLLEDSGIEAELVSDLNEVLVTAVQQKSGGRFLFSGKEKVLNTLQTRRTQSGLLCLESADCLRAFALESGFSLMVLGRVGKSAGGYKFELQKISLTGIPDKSFSRMVAGDVSPLIEEVEASADWVLAPDKTFLKVTADEPGGILFLDGRELGPAQDKPIEITPGLHMVAIKKKDRPDAKGKVECRQGTLCELSVLFTAAAGDPNLPGNPPPLVEDGGGSYTFISLAWICAGLTAASLGTGIYFSLEVGNDEDAFSKQAIKVFDQFGGSPTRQQFDADPGIRSIREDGDSHSTWANIGWIGTGVFAAGSITFFVLDALDSPSSRDEDTTGRFLPIISPDMTGMAWSLTF